MNIALIDKENSAHVSARVGLVLPQGCEGLVASVANTGHETMTCESWAALAQQADVEALDIVFCHESCIASMPRNLTVPVLQLQDDGAITGEMLAPLLALAVDLAGKTARLSELENIVSGIRSGTAMVGNTPIMRRLQATVSRAADCDATVLIEGPVGSGKSLAARAIHLKSRRCSAQPIIQNCASLTAEALSECIARGAKTTLVLESIDRLSSAAQSVLVKHLKELTASRTPTLARLIATTSAHIPELVARGSFREDLYYRLHSFPIMVPGLHERLDDISLLAKAILDAGVPASGTNHQGLTPAAHLMLESMPWPGNVAQLESTLRRALILAAGAPIDCVHLTAPATTAAQGTGSTATSSSLAGQEAELTEASIRPFEDEEKDLLGRALQATKGNVRRAAQLLGIGRATLYRKIQQYQLRLH